MRAECYDRFGRPASRLTAATDGSADSPGPGPGGWAWVTNEGTWGWGNCRGTTHNRMELKAVLKLLESHPDRPLLIQTDSTYVLNIFTDELNGWGREGSRTAKGTELANFDLIERSMNSWRRGKTSAGNGSEATRAIPSTKTRTGWPALQDPRPNSDIGADLPTSPAGCVDYPHRTRESPGQNGFSIPTETIPTIDSPLLLSPEGNPEDAAAPAPRSVR